MLCVHHMTILNLMTLMIMIRSIRAELKCFEKKKKILIIRGRLGFIHYVKGWERGGKFLPSIIDKMKLSNDHETFLLIVHTCHLRIQDLICLLESFPYLKFVLHLRLTSIIWVILMTSPNRDYDAAESLNFRTWQNSP